MQSSWYNRALRNASGVHVCGHKLKDGKGKCEREVRNGEKYCWQHESEKRAKKDLDKLMKRVKRRKSQKITMPRGGRRGGGMGGGRRGAGGARKVARQPLQPTTTSITGGRPNIVLPPTTTSHVLPKILRPGGLVTRRDEDEEMPEVGGGGGGGDDDDDGGGGDSEVSLSRIPAGYTHGGEGMSSEARRAEVMSLPQAARTEIMKKALHGRPSGLNAAELEIYRYERKRLEEIKKEKQERNEDVMVVDSKPATHEINSEGDRIRSISPRVPAQKRGKYDDDVEADYKRRKKGSQSPIMKKETDLEMAKVKRKSKKEKKEEVKMERKEPVLPTLGSKENPYPIEDDEFKAPLPKATPFKVEKLKGTPKIPSRLPGYRSLSDSFALRDMSPRPSRPPTPQSPIVEKQTGPITAGERAVRDLPPVVIEDEEEKEPAKSKTPEPTREATPQRKRLKKLSELEAEAAAKVEAKKLNRGGRVTRELSPKKFPPLNTPLPTSAFGELNEKLNPIREGVKRAREEFGQPQSRPATPQPGFPIPPAPPISKNLFGSTYVPPASTKTFQEEIVDANKEMKRRERQERLRKAKERREGEKIAAEKFKAEKEENEARRERLRKEYEEEKAKEQKKEKPKKRTGAEKVIAEALHSFQNKEKGSKVSASTVKSAEKFLKEHNKGIEEGRMNALEYKPPSPEEKAIIPKHRMTALEKELYKSQHMSKLKYRKSAEGRHEEYLKKLAGIQFPTPPPPPQSTVIKRRKLTHEESSAPLAIEHKAEEKQPAKKRDLSFLKVAAKKMKAAREEKEKEMRKNAIIEAAQKKFLAIHGPDWMSDPNLPTPSEERKQKKTAAKEKKNAEALPHVDIEKPYVRSKGVKQAVNHPYQYAPLGIETAQDKLRREAYGWPSPRDRAKWMMNEFRGKAKKEAPPFPPVSNSSSNVFFPPMVVNTKERPKAIMGPQKESKRAALTTGPSTMERPEASKFVGSSNTPLVSSSNPYYKPYNERELAARVRRDSNGNILNMRELFGFDEMNRKNQEALHKLLSENKAIQKRYLALK